MPGIKNIALIAVIFSACLGGSSNTGNIVGEWLYEVDSTVIPGISKSDSFLFSIRADSTVTMDLRPDRPSATPGWHVGGKTHGTWKMLDSNQIQFLYYLDEYKYKFPVVYNIAELNNKNLVLQTSFYSNDSTKINLRFKRL